MLDLQKCFNECERELSSIGIKHGQISKVEIGDLPIRTMGLCIRQFQDGKFIYKIQINKLLLKSSESYKGLKETMLHEILHTCPGSFKHTGEWKKLAQYVNTRLGYSISRCSSYQKSNTDDDEVLKASKYAVKCKECGLTFYRNRMSNLIKNPQNYKCICNGKLERIK